MKKLLFTSIFSISFLFKSFADEGMWLPLLLGQQVYNDMVKRGLKLSKEQLYSLNKPSIKDAIVIFGGGCTGEIVSAQGLLFTNHHCGYGAIASASTVEHNYLKDGFYAKTKTRRSGYILLGFIKHFFIGAAATAKKIAKTPENIFKKIGADNYFGRNYTEVLFNISSFNIWRCSCYHFIYSLAHKNNKIYRRLSFVTAIF